MKTNSTSIGLLLVEYSLLEGFFLNLDAFSHGQEFLDHRIMNKKQIYLLSSQTLWLLCAPHLVTQLYFIS